MRPISGSDGGYRAVLSDDESLKTFMKAMADFDMAFCKAMNDGLDYTLRLEVRGDCSTLLHVRVNLDGFSRPKGTPRKTYVGEPIKAKGSR